MIKFKSAGLKSNLGKINKIINSNPTSPLNPIADQALRHPYFGRLPAHHKLHDKSNENSMSSSPDCSPHSLSR